MMMMMMNVCVCVCVSGSTHTRQRGKNILVGVNWYVVWTLQEMSVWHCPYHSGMPPSEPLYIPQFVPPSVSLLIPHNVSLYLPLYIYISHSIPRPVPLYLTRLIPLSVAHLPQSSLVYLYGRRWFIDLMPRYATIFHILSVLKGLHPILRG